MSRGRPPRRVRFRPATNMVNVVIDRAARFTAAEIDLGLQPVQQAFRALREGVANEMEWTLLASAVEIALSIEGQGIVRGLRGHLVSAELALAEIRRRAMSTGAWRPTALYYQELDDVGEAIRLHRFQLEQLSTAEVAKAVEAARTRVHQAGGQVIEIRQLQGVAA